MPVSLVLEVGCDRCGGQVLTVPLENSSAEPVSSALRLALAASGWGWEDFLARVLCPACLEGVGGQVVALGCPRCSVRWPVTFLRRDGVLVAPRGEQFCPSCGEYGLEGPAVG